MKKLICRYDKDANTDGCSGCQYGCIARKAATINPEFEKAVMEMEQNDRTYRRRQ